MDLETFFVIRFVHVFTETTKNMKIRNSLSKNRSQPRFKFCLRLGNLEYFFLAIDEIL